MNWFKNLFGLDAMSKVILHRKDSNISEPVYSLIECVKNNPKRFTVTSRDISYTIKDNITKECWKISIYQTYTEEFSHVMEKPFFINETEAKYLFTQIRTVYADRIKRKQEIFQKRKDRITKKERKRLLEIYK